MLLDNPRTTEEIKEEMKMTREMKTTIQNLRNAAKAVLRGKFMLIQNTSGNKSHINTLTLHLKELGKETKSKVSGGK